MLGVFGMDCLKKITFILGYRPASVRHRCGPRLANNVLRCLFGVLFHLSGVDGFIPSNKPGHEKWRPGIDQSSGLRSIGSVSVPTAETVESNGGWASKFGTLDLLCSRSC